MDFTPVTVIVSEGRYDIIDEPTPRKQFLADLLMAIGGINETVPLGTYKFNAIPGAGGLIVSLTPA